jgi:hypothetical protein
MIRPHKAEHSRPGDIERDIEVIRALVKKMARIRSFIPTSSVVSAPHIRPRSDPLKAPAIPLAIGVEADGNRQAVHHRSA